MMFALLHQIICYVHTTCITIYWLYFSVFSVFCRDTNNMYMTLLKQSICVSKCVSVHGIQFEDVIKFADVNIIYNVIYRGL